MLTSDQVDAEDYVARATRVALAGVATGIAGQGGRFVASDSWQDEQGHWLRVRSTLDDLPDVEVHYARILLPAAGPDKDAETEGIIYGSGFEERLHVRARTAESVDGVVVL